MTEFTELCDDLIENSDISSISKKRRYSAATAASKPDITENNTKGDIMGAESCIDSLPLNSFANGYLPRRSILPNSSIQHMPLSKTVNLPEDLVIEFIIEMTRKAMEIWWTGRVQVEDTIFLKYAPGKDKELLTMNEGLKKAHLAFNEIKCLGQCGSKL
uniref:Uncharacterized protein n=1 Tax=Glossina palpalis gambiensis TaxID=67801 RepID=A0A1B0BYA2_9MUSC